MIRIIYTWFMLFSKLFISTIVFIINAYPKTENFQ